MIERADRFAGLLLGTAVGDALGLPREMLSRRRAERLFGPPPLHHAFLAGRGMTSDDTEHTCILAQALLRHPGDPERFARSLAWGLRLWLLGLPAGIGRATLRSIVKLWLGFSPTHSGVFSAGNGPAMRVALLGLCFGEDIQHLRTFVRISTHITHTDPKAERAALLVALAAHHGSIHGPPGVTTFVERAFAVLGDEDAMLTELLTTLETHRTREASVAELTEALGLSRGVTGYIYHTVPVALYGWLRWPGDFRRAVEEVIALGGDTDTVGAITGAMVGATLGESAIPSEWLNRLWEWPRSVSWMRALAARLAEQFPQQGEGKRAGPLPLFWPGLLPRNALFFVLVLLHALRRLLPPY